MVEMLNKLEFMLMGLRQMNLSSVCAWFPKDRREDIVEAINNSSKFKLEDGIVTLKSESEMYEEGLQNDILKDLMDDDTNKIDDVLNNHNDFSAYDDDDFSSYDDELEIVEEAVVEKEIIQKIEEINQVNPVESFEEFQEFKGYEDFGSFEELEDLIIEEDIVEMQPEVMQPEIMQSDIKEYYAPSYQKPKSNVIIKEEVVVKEIIKEVVKEPVNVNKIDGATLSYESILKLISEYNNNIENQLNYAVENRYEVRERAIKTFYKNKYNVRVKEEGIANSDVNVYGLVHKKKGVEVAYLVICKILNDSILNYILDNYDDEVVYLCPIDGIDVDFEVGLNEFYLKDTDIIFDKYLEHYVIVEESNKKIKKMEVIIGNH